MPSAIQRPRLFARGRYDPAATIWTSCSADASGRTTILPSLAARIVNALDRPLISVHFPKASGSSFRVALEAAFGQSAVLGSYDCDPLDPANPMWIDPDWFLRHRPCDVKPFGVVHGHLPIVKYELLPSAYRVVMLREPIENLISIYYYWRHLISTGYRGHALFEFVKAQRLSLLEVAEMPAIRNLMSGTYFGGYDMGRFDVIGAHDNRTAFVEAVSTLIHAPLSVDIRENVTPPSEERDNVLADAKVIAKLRDLLQDDIRFFDECVGRSNGRRGPFALRRFVGLRFSARRGVRYWNR
jgi:hypothetical protein